VLLIYLFIENQKKSNNHSTQLTIFKAQHTQAPAKATAKRPIDKQVRTRKTREYPVKIWTTAADFRFIQQLTVKVS
jgi:hypothetical protein